MEAEIRLTGVRYDFMIARNKIVWLSALILTLSYSQGLQSVTSANAVLAKGSKSKAKAKESKEEKMKDYFDKWFAKFFSTLFYAKDVSEIKPYYSNAFMRGYDKIPDNARSEVLDKMKLAYFAKPVIQTVRMHPSGVSCDITLKGYRSVYKKTGYGIGIYRMIKENNVWKIDSSAQKGQAYTR